MHPGIYVLGIYRVSRMVRRMLCHTDGVVLNATNVCSGILRWRLACDCDPCLSVLHPSYIHSASSAYKTPLLESEAIFIIGNLIETHSSDDKKNKQIKNKKNRNSRVECHFMGM